MQYDVNFASLVYINGKRVSDGAMGLEPMYVYIATLCGKIKFPKGIRLFYKCCGIHSIKHLDACKPAVGRKRYTAER